ncbi:MAG: TrkA family potassium uptake protein [Clostridia bacterium]|nr:TrkA family potassium uptake protein [Clostridia bacterium]
MKSVLIIGMGRLGTRLAEKMSDLGNDVMVVDTSEKIINEIAPRFTDAYVADCTNENVLKNFGVQHFDVCFVTIGDNFQASLEITSLLKELGAKYVVSKAGSDIQAKFLLRNGADEVVYPERDIADKLAIKHNAKDIFDLIELSKEYAIFEIPVKKNWIGNSIQSLDIRKKYHVNVLAIKNNNVINIPSPDYSFVQNDHVILLGKQNDVFKLNNKK